MLGATALGSADCGSPEPCYLTARHGGHSLFSPDAVLNSCDKNRNQDLTCGVIWRDDDRTAKIYEVSCQNRDEVDRVLNQTFHAEQDDDATRVCVDNGGADYSCEYQKD